MSECDEYICGCGRYLSFLYEKKQRSDNGGYESLFRVYECENCDDCPFREICLKSSEPESDRRIYVNRRLNKLKEIAKAYLESEKGLTMRSKRPVEVESVFGDIKGNFGVRKHVLRGLEKVKIEWGLYSIAHNMGKMAAARN